MVAPAGCGQNDAVNCTIVRGGTYDDTKSSSWNPKALYGLEEGNLGYVNSDQSPLVGSYGYDNLGLQGNGANLSVNHQVIATIQTKDFYLGNLGLSPYPNNFSSSEDSSPSLLASLKAQNQIPSLSYSYTAGASYRKGSSIISN